MLISLFVYLISKAVHFSEASMIYMANNQALAMS